MADPHGLRARIATQLLREGDDDRDDSVVVWNGMGGAGPCASPAIVDVLSRTAGRLTDGFPARMGEKRILVVGAGLPTTPTSP